MVKDSSEELVLCPACGKGVLHLCYLEVRNQPLLVNDSPEDTDTDVDESYGSYAMCCDKVVWGGSPHPLGGVVWREVARMESCGAYFTIAQSSRDIYLLPSGAEILPYLRQVTREQALLEVLGLREGLTVSPPPELGPSTVEVPTRDGRMRTKVLYTTYNEED